MTREHVATPDRSTPIAPPGDELLLRQALERSAIGSCLVAPNGTFVWVNDALCALFGRSADELARTTWQQLTHPDDLMADQSLVDEAIAAERDSFRMFKRYVRPDGSIVWGDLTVTAMYESSGALRLFLSQVVDITEAVARTEQFRRVSENAADFIVESTVDGIVEWVSPSVEQVLGWPADQLVGTPFSELIHPEDRDTARSSVQPARGTVALPPGFATRVRCIDGSYRRLSGRTVTLPRTAEHSTERVDAWRDVENEARALETALRSSTLLTAELDAELDCRVILTAVRDESGEIVDFEYVEANPAACRSLQLTRDELIGRRMTEFFPDVVGTGRLQEYAGVVESGEPQVWQARPLPDVDGSVACYIDARIVKVVDGVSYAWCEVTARVLAEQRLAASEHELRLITKSVTDIVVMSDVAGILTYVSPSVTRTLGWHSAELVGTRVLDLLHPDDRHVVREAAERAMAGEATQTVARVRHREGHYRWIESAVSPVVDDEGTLVGRSAVWRDVTDRVRLEEQRATAESQLKASEERYRLLAENTADVVILIKDGRIDWVSPSVEHEFGAPADDWIGRIARLCVEAEDVPILREVLDAVLNGEHRLFRARAVAPNGQRHWVEAHARPYVEVGGAVTGFIASFRIIDDLIEVESELDRRARFDELTGLLNRSEALRRIAEVTMHTPRRGSRTAVLFCDVDRFKDINDEHGHAAGDEVLRAIGARIAAVVREVDYAARIGGDEILVLLPGVHALDDATAVADKIREATSQPVTVAGGVTVVPRLSIGVTLMRPGETADQLVERADDAMYLAKKAGRNRIVAID